MVTEVIEHAMSQRHLIIVGGGLAGLSAGVYAQRSGYRTTIVEHNIALGGVCTAWHRGPYVVDGCIHWLTGGPFDQVYEELGILDRVPRRTLDEWVRYRDASDGFEFAIVRDLDEMLAKMKALAPEDTDEIEAIRGACDAIQSMAPFIDAPELMTFRDGLRAMWEMRGAIGAMVHFRGSIGDWAHTRLKSERLQRLITRILPAEAPALFLLMILSYLHRGWLSRPVGGTAAFRDALVDAYTNLGGATRLHSTVDEIIVREGRATGVRLSDGTILEGDLVLSTSSAPETVLRLLGGEWDPEPTRTRLADWKLFDAIVLASFGVDVPLAGEPALVALDGLAPIDVGGRDATQCTVRYCNDDPSFAPPGHCVVQVMVTTDYEWWATRGARYGQAKEEVAARLLTILEQRHPGLSGHVRVTDVATPLTYWGMARSWRGAFEGWMPETQSAMQHVQKKLEGLEDFYMAGQWVEPGGGVPTAVMSGRQAVQLMCVDDGRAFVAR
jgi:phytoene dehydrogenase-like protein